MKTIIPKQISTALLLALCASSAFAFKFEIPDEYKEKAAAQQAAEEAAKKEQLDQVQASTDTESTGMSFGQPEAAEDEVAASLDEQVIEPIEPEEKSAPEDFAEGEGRIAGQVFDKETGEPVRGVAIFIKDMDIGTITDSQGRYRINNVPAGEYELTFFKSGYIEATVTESRVLEGELLKLDFALPPRPVDMSDEVYVLQDFSVTAEEAISQNVALLALRQTSVASLEALSSEDFAKFAASDAAEAISKISGASLSDGKYVVMRGLNDRYNTTLINGVRLPSPDPDRKAVAMDIFPTSLFDSIVARKTYTSDMPGESSGGSIELRTKSAPEEPFVKFSVGFGQQMTSSNTDQFLADPEQIGYLDWLKGEDDVRGFSLAPGSRDFLSDYPTTVGEIDFPRMAPTRKGFPNWGDRSYSLSMGDSWRVNEWLSVGAILGVKSGEKRRSSYKEVFRKNVEIDGAPRLVVDEIAVNETGGGVFSSEQEYSLSALMGLGFQISDHSSLNYTYLRAETLSSKATISNYRQYNLDPALFGGGLDFPAYHDKQDIELGVEERLLEAHQFSGEHVFQLAAPNDWTLNWYFTDANMAQEEPDIRNVAEFFPTEKTFSSNPGLEPLSRYQRETEQSSEMYGLSLGQEISLGENASLNFKFGLDRESSERDFLQLEMLNQDAQYVTDPEWAAMPFADATGNRNFSETDRYHNDLASVVAQVEDLFVLNRNNAISTETQAVENRIKANNAQNLSLDDFTDKRNSANTNIVALSVVPGLYSAEDLSLPREGGGLGPDYDNFQNVSFFDDTDLFDSLIGHLDSGNDLASFTLSPEHTSSLSPLQINLLKDYANAVFAEGEYEEDLDAFNVALANEASAVAKRNQIEAEYDFVLNEFATDLEEWAALASAPAASFESINVPSFSYFGESHSIFRTPKGFAIYGDDAANYVQFQDVGGFFQARGQNEVKSFYFSGDLELRDLFFFESVRLASGVRNESTKLSYELLDNAPGEPDPSSSMGGNVSPEVVRAESIDQNDQLGYFALIFEPLENLKIHLSQSTTVAKPTFREIAPFPIFNLADRSFEIGNPGLTLRAPLGDRDPDTLTDDDYVVTDDFAGLDIAEVESRDIRFEYFTPFDGMVSLGYFEKDVAAPIERVYAYTAGGVAVNTFINNDNDAELTGFEFELQQNLGILEELLGSWGEMFTIGGNFTQIDAEVTRSTYEQDALNPVQLQIAPDPSAFQSGGTLGDRPLYNQPEYVANAFISWDFERTGTMVTLSNSWMGKQLDRAGGVDSSGVGSPDLFWDEFSALNLVIEQKLTDHIKLRISAKNIDRPVREMYEDRGFIDALGDSVVYADSSTPYEGSTGSTEYRDWRSRQQIDPTYSISISGSF